MTTPSRLPDEAIRFVLETARGDIPDETLAFGQRCLLDLLGVAAAGRSTELSGIIHEHAIDHFAAGSHASPLLFDGRVASPAGAALAGGMTIDSLDAHDGHKITKGHTGAHQLPALLAMTSALALDDPVEFLTSLVVAYEFATRAGIALHATAPDYHTSGAWGAVGAAAICSRQLGLDEQQTFEAMGIAEYHGPRSQMMRVIDHPTMLKDGSGWGAMAGVSAAWLAAAGFTGAPAITVNDPKVDHVWTDLGQSWIIHDQYFKPHPVCRWAQPAVEAALSLRRQHNLHARDISAVHVTTFHEAARLAVATPTTTEQAQYSLPFPVAAALTRGQLTAAEVGADGLADEQIRELAAAVTIDEDAAHNRAFPGNRFARVRIELNDGSSLVSEDTEPRGDPEAHLSDGEIRDKFRLFAEPVLGAERAKAIEVCIDELPHATSLAPLLEHIYSPI